MQGSTPGPMKLITHGYALADFAQTIQTRAGRVIVDKTGLTGAYDIELETEGPQIPGQVPTTPPEGLSLFTALQEQLGLKLEPERGQVDVLVVDHVDKPIPD